MTAYNKLPGISPAELERLVRARACSCKYHVPCACGHIWDPRRDEVYLVVQCRNCKRARCIFLGDIFQWHSSYGDEEVVYPIDGVNLYAQKRLLP